MTWSGLVCGAMVLGGCGLCSAAEAIASPEPASPAGDANDSYPYAVIVVRNAFGLNPAPPPQAPPAAPEPDLPEVIFSGTAGIQGRMKAMFALKFKDPKKAQESPTYMSLAEGETSGPVQLVKINPSGEEVEILNSGTRVMLTMKDNGFERKGAPATGATALPGMRQLPGGAGVPLPGAPPQAAAPGATADSGPGINLGRTAISPIRGNINVQGGGPAIGGAPMNPGTTVLPINNPSLASVAGNPAGSGVKIAGGAPPPPNNNPASTGLSFSGPTGGGTPQNFTPPPTVTTKIAPPLPPMPGQ